MKYYKVRFDRETSKIIVKNVVYTDTDVVEPVSEDGCYYIPLQDLLRIKRDMLEVATHNSDEKKNQDNRV